MVLSYIEAKSNDTAFIEIYKNIVPNIAMVMLSWPN